MYRHPRLRTQEFYPHTLYRFLLNPLFLTLSPIIIPLRFMVVALSLSVLLVVHLVLYAIAPKTQDPLPRGIELVFNFTNRALFRLICLACSCRVETSGRITERILVCNHSTLFDVAVLIASGVTCIISKSDIWKLWPFRPGLFLSKSLFARNHSNTIEKLKERYSGDGMGYPPICIFCTGTTVENDCLIYFRSGAFYPLCPVQFVNISYSLGYDYTFTVHHPLTVVKNILLNPVGCAKVEFLEAVAPNAGEEVESFRNRCQALYSVRTGRQMLPYTYKDMLWFVGFDYEASAYYMQCFGWMGRYSAYRRLCKRCGRNALVQWGRSDLCVE